MRERRDSRRGCVPAPLPVVSWVLALKSLIINGIRFCSFACFFVLIRVFWILRFSGCGLRGCCGFSFIFSFWVISGFAGFLPVVSCVFGFNSLIINGDQFLQVCRSFLLGLL